MLSKISPIDVKLMEIFWTQRKTAVDIWNTSEYIGISLKYNRYWLCFLAAPLRLPGWGTDQTRGGNHKEPILQGRSTFHPHPPYIHISHNQLQRN